MVHYALARRFSENDPRCCELKLQPALLFRFVMPELEVRTSRVRRGWIDRLKGYDRVYETKVTDGERAAYGRGPSREASLQAALRNWNL